MNSILAEMARGLWEMLPGAGLIQRAYDATKLAGALIQHRRERALVLAEERQTQMAQVCFVLTIKPPSLLHFN